tara:strand:- start:15 stop:218 length:204 start_codon:yes stop_codon:yes gene_type:complete
MVVATHTPVTLRNEYSSLIPVPPFTVETRIVNQGPKSQLVHPMFSGIPSKKVGLQGRQCGDDHENSG